MLNLDRRILILGAGLLVLLVFVGGIKYSDIRNKPPDADEIILDPSGQSAENKRPVAEGGKIVIYVTGEVAKPGIYKLAPGSRVYEALELAEPLDDADLSKINLARIMQDEEGILVPSFAEESAGDLSLPAQSVMAPANRSLNATASNTDIVNINTASAQELDDKLPGVGPTLAQRIIDYRTSNGPFQTAEDILQVSGIGDKKFSDMKDMICVR